MANPDQHLLDKLDFWHKLESFIPFDLDYRARSKDEKKKKFWRSYQKTSQLCFDTPPEGMEVSSYKLFLGVFDKSEIKGLVEERKPRTESEELDEEQRADLQGLTCMASLGLSCDAAPNFEDFEISTVPWVIGQSRRKGINTLSSDAFQVARSQLAKGLQNFSAKRPQRLKLVDGEEVPDPSLAPCEVDQLIDLLSKWSGFRPSQDHPAALLEVVFKKKKNRSDPANSAEAEEAEGRANQQEEDEVLPEIGILNSFYIEDIERAMKVVRGGNPPRTLRQYLTPLAESERIDLYSDEGKERIIEALSPQRMNMGRWLGNPDHAMSLMQQFAINTGLDELGEEGLFSVNGPPGTGKTTLLRDVIAENITQRAAVLAELRKPTDASQKVKRGEITPLIPELTGFEMVVASSNNAAVDNISRDLPKGEAIWDRAHTYLQPVAHKLAAQEWDGNCRKLSSNERPWGLIAAAMGKANNRNQFVDKVFFNKIPPNSPKTWSGDQCPLNLWQWRDETLKGQNKQQTFRAACDVYKAAQHEVKAAIAEQQAFFELQKLVGGHTEKSWCRIAQQQVDMHFTAINAATSCLQKSEQDHCEQQGQLDELIIEGQLIEKTKPIWLKCLFNTKEARVYNDRRSKNAEAQMQLRRTLKQLKAQISSNLKSSVLQAERAHQKALEALEVVQKDWQHKNSVLSSFIERFGAISPPENLSDLEADHIQINGFWHTKELAALRSNLFKAALDLHEAWLLAVSQKNGSFAKNLYELPAVLKGRFEGSAEERLALWQSLFMFVPVISSTFASIARQFDGVGPDSIGWLFIDEAGQAVPQAAVGALFRARRAIVIGDPLQIEPVFTLPKQLITKLAETSPATESGSYSPDKVSVQVLADQANAFGISVVEDGGEAIWIGSPLRVHRRCIDPMFAIANKIAYEERMVFGLPSRTSGADQEPFLGKSCWINLPGTVQGRQAVPEQVEFVSRLIARLFLQFGKGPELYIISPFKEVKEQISSRLQAPELWSSLGVDKPRGKALQRWASNHIGTVHTFQGKEEDSAIMVLGADQQKEGSARWAASKPNILNVALTRAKRRFYLVGDRQLWGQQRFFQQAAQTLPAQSPASFLKRAEREWQRRDSERSLQETRSLADIH